MHLTNVFLFLSLGMGTAMAAVSAPQKETEAQTRDLSNMFYSDTLPPKPETPSPTLPAKVGSPVKKAERRVGLKYRLWHLTAGPNCENIDVQEVSAANIFRSGDRLRLFFESNVDGYLYVLQKGSTGRDKLLFPDPQGADNRIKRGMQYAVPSKKWLAFDNNPGEERLTVVVSRTPLKSMPTATTPQEEKTVTVLSVVSELNQSVRPRDLVLFQEKEVVPSASTKSTVQPIAAQASQAMIVINTSSESNNAAYVEIRLKHQ
jgi:hypothetical protein